MGRPQAANHRAMPVGALSVDDAIAEITERQRTLYGEAPLAPRAARPVRLTPTEDAGTGHGARPGTGAVRGESAAAAAGREPRAALV